MFLDTSVIVELMRGVEGTKRVETILNHIANCVDAEQRIAQLDDIVIVIPLNEIICMNASVIKKEMRSQKISKFSLIDALILASARHIDQKLLTMDTDFRKAEDAISIR